MIDIYISCVQRIMQTSQVLMILKIIFIIFFVAIVIIVGSLPLRMQTFKRNKFLKSMGTTFAGALFVNVAIIHILPQSADSIEDHLKDGQDKDVFPLANLLVMIGFMITIFFTRIISTHSHDDEESQPSTSFVEPSPTDSNPPLLQNPSSLLSGQHEEGDVAEPPEEQLEEKEPNHQDTYFLTLAMYFHTIFEGIAIGVQNTVGGFLSTAVAIAFHKWADALSMGIHYRSRNVPTRTAYWLIIGQAALNALAIGFGWAIASFGDFVEAIFLSISAGTFLAISTMQMLSGQLHRSSYRPQKFLVLVFSTAFVSLIWFLQNAIFSQDSADS